jgi:hypothetical protein
MKKLFLSLALTTLGTGAFAQSYQWAHSFAGTSDDYGKSVAVDAAGNVYSTGYFSNTVDLDPGPGTYTLSSPGGFTDVYISKLDAAGNFLWARTIGGSNNDITYGISLDASGNVYTVLNYASNDCDFDPGPGTYTLSLSGASDIAISKLDASGNFIWAKSMGGAGYDAPACITTDATGNVYTTGYVGAGVADFDPGVATYTLTSAGSNDMYISKLDASGNFVWAKLIGGTANDAGRAIQADASGNLYLTGIFGGVTDFDPSPSATFNMTASGTQDIFILKLDAAGNFGWAKKFTGASVENGNSLGLDASGNVYIAGSYVGTVDFDPGAATYSLTPVTGADIFIAKLDNSGNFIWAKSMGGTAASDHAYAASVDAAGNVYATGLFGGTNDFDPGPGTYTLTTVGGFDIFILKLDASGNFGWVRTMGSTSSDSGSGIAIDATGTAIYATGYFSSPVDFDAGPGVANIITLGGADGFLTKYINCNMPASAAMIASASSSVCPGSTMAFSTATVTGATSYSWTVPAGASITAGQNTNSITVTFGSTSGTIVVTPSNTCGSSASASLALTVNPLPAIGVTVSPVSATVCSGSSVTVSGTGATTYTWSNGVTNGAVFNPTTSATYTVTGTDGNGCTNTATTAITVNALPNLTVSASPSSTVCTGGSLTLSGAGATTYTWSGGITNGTAFTPTSSATYTLSGTDANGCVNTTSSSVVISNTLAINVIASNSVVCNGSLVTLSGAGATTYTWSNGVANGVAFTPTATASYTVTGTDGNGCSATAVKTITVNALPALGATTNRSLICAGQTSTITALGAVTYTWNTNQTSASIVVTPSVTTNYTVSGTGTNGCIGTVAFTQSVSPCTGFEEMNTTGLEINSYPNPNTGEFTIVSNADVDVVLFNELGETLQTIALTDVNEHRYTVEGLSSGVYILVGQANRKTFSQKIIVMK